MSSSVSSHSATFIMSHLRFVIDADLQACVVLEQLEAGLFFLLSDVPVVSVWCTELRSDLEPL